MTLLSMFAQAPWMFGLGYKVTAVTQMEGRSSTLRNQAAIKGTVREESF